MTKKENLLKGIIKENPLFVSLLGTCPALATTTSLESALGMGILFMFVLIGSNIVISLLRKIIPDEVKIPLYIVIIATFVTIVNPPVPSTSRTKAINIIASVYPIPIPIASSRESNTLFLEAYASALPRTIQFTTISEINTPKVSYNSGSNASDSIFTIVTNVAIITI